MTRILVTNDDGIDAPGLLCLARATAAAGYELTIAAPVRQSSGSSASITAAEEDGRILIDRRDFADLPDTRAFAVHGGPGLIALIAARGAFGDPGDVILSGVNHGANVGRAILHSGTVGAALTGGLNGARGMAVSLDVGLEPDGFEWAAASDAAVRLLPGLLAAEAGTVINLNVPNTAHARGIREATLAPFGIVQTTLSEHHEQHVRLAVEELPNDPAPGSDAALLAAGWITATALDPVSAVPLSFDVTTMHPTTERTAS